MKHRSLLVIALLGFAAFATPNVQAGGKGKSKAVMHTTITSISGNTITNETEIDYNGQRVALSALQPGMRVEITNDMSVGGVASRINASEAPKVKAAGKK